MQAGSARVEITPPKGGPMGGYIERAEPAEDVHDPLYARALVLEDGQRRVALLSADIHEVPPAFAAEVRYRIERELGIPDDHTLFAVSHTHAGPLVAGRRVGVPDALYVDTLRDRLVGAVRAACGALRPARIGAGSGKLYLGANRRARHAGGKAPGRYASPYARIFVAAEEGGGPIALLFTYGAHPNVLGPENRLISGDYAGQAERTVEENFGGTATALFALGFAGDVEANHSKRDFEEVETFGAALGRAVLEAMKAIPLESGLALRARSLRVALPLAPMPTLEAAERRLMAERDRLSALLGRGASKAEMAQQRAVADRAQQVLQAASQGRAVPRAELEVQAIAIGRIALLGVSAEPFAEHEKALGELSPFEHTLPISCANGCIGYIPTAEAFAEGGYEIESAPCLHGLLPFVPEAATVFRQAMARVLVDLAE